MKVIALLIFSFYFLQGCSDLTLNLPVSRFESPESNGKLWQTNFGASVAQEREVTVVDDAASRPPVLNKVTVNKNSELALFLSLGLSKMIDAKIRGKLSDEQLLVKIQLLGQSAIEAVPGNFSLAITGAIGGGTVTRSGDQAITFGPANSNWSGTASYFSDDLALILGYRFNEWLLLYGGPYMTEYNAKASVHQDATSDGNNPAADYSLREYGRNTGANLALQFGVSKNWSISVEEVYSGLTWANGASAYGLTSGLQVSAYY